MASDGNREGIPNVLKEAMLMGVQVISTTHSGIPELIEHERNGYLCAENDPEGIAKLIEYLSNHTEQWQTTADNAAKTILTEYTPRKTTEDLLEAYRATIA
jgi:colanic acid/amylovoran biosynthesis glycosyltransferase